ncbi:MAG: AAA family ATPase [Eubacteriales bacterium]|nr:AAA family ATPase [Eubacteriales bacterium]
MRYGLIGETLGHSYSARLHALLGDESYILRPVARQELDAFLTVRAFDGLNVTIPYKQAVIPYCDVLGDTARAVGSVNTLLMRRDGTLFGDNTDAYGFAQMAAAAGIHFAGKKVLVLGSGGTGLTACHVIREAGGEPVVVSRRGENDYEHLEKHSNATILVNATPVGMYPNVSASPVDLARLPNLEGVLDVIYNPLRTRLLQQAEQLSLLHAGGLTMLVWQAARARALFDGRELPAETVRAAEASLRREAGNLVLVGMPGSGKTVVGQRCAKKLGMTFVDTDTQIVRRAGKPIPRIFAEDGEAAFRALEKAVIAEYGAMGGLVIATGGGAVLNAENRANLRMNGVVVWLITPLDRLQTKGRPLSTGMEALRRMDKERTPLYRAAADYTVENNRALIDCVQNVLEGYDEALRR